MHVFTIDKGSGQVYMDLGSQDVPGSLNTQIPQTPGPRGSTASSATRPTTARAAPAPTAPSARGSTTPARARAHGANTFAMPTTVSFSDTWDNQCATLEARSQ